MKRVYINLPERVIEEIKEMFPDIAFSKICRDIIILKMQQLKETRDGV